MLPERRYEPQLHGDLSALFQEVLNAAEGRTEGVSKCMAEYARRGQERIGQPDQNGATTPAEFAQLILRVAAIYKKNLEQLPALQAVRQKIEVLLGQIQ